MKMNDVISPRRIELLGIPVDCINMDQAVQWAKLCASQATPRSIIAINPEKIIKAQRDQALQKLLRSADLLIPDGIGVVVAMRLLGLGFSKRVPGAELMPRLCALAAHEGYRVFLFGASQEVNEGAALKLSEQFPGIKIVGTQHGYIPDSDMPQLITKINSTQTDFLFIALGSPMQELWMATYLPQLHVKICQGVGGTLDVLAGKVKRAPKIFRSIHLEWLYRLLAQPSRLMRQKALPLFVIQILKKRFTQHSTPLK